MEKEYDSYIMSALNECPETREDFAALKKRLSKQYRLPIPTNADLRDRYNRLVAEKKITPNRSFEQLLMSRLIRTQSGVAVVAVLTKPYPCPGKCIYCPTEKDMPKSYLSNEPAVMRAIDSQFDPYLQVANRLRSLELNGHSTDKIELIVMGGTFSFLPKEYQKKFIIDCFRACNEYGKKSKNKRVGTKITEALLQEQQRNERANHRIVGLTLETRPDYIDEAEIVNFRNLGCTRVELGVQSIFNDVLKRNQRGHLTEATIRATKLLKDAGFKINYHMMPGLPGSTPEGDFAMFQELFANQAYQPDMLKIYPTVVLRDSQLYDIWKKKDYTPLDDSTFERLAIRIKNEVIPPYVRIARLVRDVPTPSIVAGPIVSNLRQIIAKKSHCQCIRCREVRDNYAIDEAIILDRIDYTASDGKEIFLQFVSPDKQKLFALLRLRVPSRSDKNGAFLLLKHAALIREVHTYGKLAKISAKDGTSPQHFGLGKKLLLEAERISREEFGMKKIAIISGVGVRGYYRKAGYRLNRTYMVKNLLPHGKHRVPSNAKNT